MCGDEPMLNCDVTLECGACRATAPRADGRRSVTDVGDVSGRQAIATRRVPVPAAALRCVSAQSPSSGRAARSGDDTSPAVDGRTPAERSG